MLLNSQVVSIWLNQIILSCPSLETYPSLFLCRLIGLLIQCLLNKCIDKDRCFCLITKCWGCYMDLQVNHVWMCKRSSNRPKEKVPSTCALLYKWITVIWIQYLIQSSWGKHFTILLTLLLLLEKNYYRCVDYFCFVCVFFKNIFCGWKFEDLAAIYERKGRFARERNLCRGGREMDEKHNREGREASFPYPLPTPSNPKSEKFAWLTITSW